MSAQLRAFEIVNPDKIVAHYTNGQHEWKNPGVVRVDSVTDRAHLRGGLDSSIHFEALQTYPVGGKRPTPPLLLSDFTVDFVRQGTPYGIDVYGGEINAIPSRGVRVAAPGGRRGSTFTKKPIPGGRRVMTATQKPGMSASGLRGLSVIIGYENTVRGEETDEQIHQDIDDGLYDAVTELMGGTNEENLKKAQPYLSMIGPLLSSFGGGPSDADKKKAEEAAKAAEGARKEAEKQEASNKKTTLYVVLGILGVGVLGFGGYMMARK